MAFTNSSLVSFTNLTQYNYTPNRTHSIDTITIHHIVGLGSVESVCSQFAREGRNGSSNYVVGADGRIGMSVQEKDISWCSSSQENDNRAITIEVADYPYEPYAVPDNVYASLINLVADICKRNGIKKLVWSDNKDERINHKNGCNMTVHRDFWATACPGTWLMSKMPTIASDVNKKLQPVDTKNGGLYGVNVPRVADSIVMYTGNYKTTGTNNYGTEALIDKNGICIGNPVVGKGNSSIPYEGRVYSGHGVGSKWIQEHIKYGSIVWVENGVIKVAYNKVGRTVTGENVARGSQYLVVYTDKYHTAPTNKYGTEVAVDSKGIALCDPVYGVGKMKVPRGGYVISGHGRASTWIQHAIKKGRKITYASNRITVDLNAK